MSFKSTSDAIFDPKDRVAPLGIIAMKGTEELAAKIYKSKASLSKYELGQTTIDILTLNCPMVSRRLR